MTAPRTPKETFIALVDGVAAERWADLPELYAPDATVLHPFASDASALLRGRGAIREHFAQAGRTGMRMTVHDVVVHETADPEVIVAEFAYHGRFGDGPPVTLPAVFVLRVRDGLIVESRDYVGPRRRPE